MAIFTTKEWKDRLSENPSRRRLSPVDGEQNVYDVSREEGDVSQEGTAFSADNMNDLENRINTSFNSFSGTKLSTRLFYNSTNPKNSDFVINDNIKNYDYVGVYYVDASKKLAGYTEIDAKDNTEAILSLSYPFREADYGGNYKGMLIRSAFITMNDDEQQTTKTKIKFQRNATMYFNIDGSFDFSSGASDTISITQIVGYKLIKNN